MAILDNLLARGLSLADVPSNGYGLLDWAVANDQLTFVERLVQRGHPDHTVDSVDAKGETLLRYS